MFVLPDVCLDVSNQWRATLREERRGGEDFSGGNGKTKKSSAFDGISVKRQTAGRKAAKLIAAETTALALCTCECVGIKKPHLWRVIIALLSLSRRRSVAVSLKAPLRLALGTF